jgi:Ca-activated chloride channel family protein
VRVRYEKPEHEGKDAGEVVELEAPITFAAVTGDYRRADDRLKVAAIAAEFAEILRESFWAKGSSLSDLAELAEDLDDELRDEDVRELVRLIERADRLHAREGRRR